MTIAEQLELVRAHCRDRVLFLTLPEATALLAELDALTAERVAAADTTHRPAGGVAYLTAKRDRCALALAACERELAEAAKGGTE